MTIDILPDDVLVEIFFYVNIKVPNLRNTWHVLVHVCRRWRYLVFTSPRWLNLRLEYEGHRPMSEALDPWPVLPVILILIMRYLPSGRPYPKSDQQWDNMVAALESEHYDRIYEIRIFSMTNSRWERLLAAMQKPFPELTHLRLSVSQLVSVLPDSFLGGSAPRLQTLWFHGIPFPSISKLLLSANGLIKLSLLDIPDSGFFSPDSMGTALTVMTRLESLEIRLRSPRFFPGPPSPPPHTRFVLPALTRLTFHDFHEYVEDLLAQIDAPLVENLDITFSIDPNFDVPQLHGLIGHAEAFKTFNHAEVVISRYSIRLDLYPKTGAVYHHQLFRLDIWCRELDRQLSSLAQVCSSSFFPLISALEELKIVYYLSPDSDRKDDMENAQWLELLDPFTALKNLYLPNDIALHVFSALLELSTERVTEVLPALQNIFIHPGQLLEGSRKAVKIFVAKRRRAGRPLSVHCQSESRSWNGITEDLVAGD